MKLRRLMALTTAVVMAASLTACGGQKTETNTQEADSGKESAASGEQITLRMAWWGSQTRHDATNKVIEMYEEQNPNVHIEAEFYDFDSYFTKLDTLVAADDVWDIFQMGGNFPKYINSIEPMDSYIEAGTIDVSDTTENFLATTRDNDGTQVGISIGTNTYGIAYDPAMFAEAGLAEPSDNWTWDEWKADCLAITEKLGIYGSSKMDNFIAGVTQRASQAEKDGNFFKKTNDGLEFTDTATFASYMQMIKDLTDAGSYPDAGAIKEIKDIEGDYLVTEDAAMTWVSSNQIASIVNAAGREIKIAPVPRITKDGSYGMGVQSSQQLCMAKSSKNKEEAAKFINYFVNDIEANKVLNGERGVPIMSKVRDVVMEQADDSSKMIYDFVDKIGNFPKEDCNVISPDPKTEIEDQYKLLLEKVQYGDVTPEDAARQLVEFAESKFTRQQ
ncbi:MULTISPECIES: ABC transporter substrate-binding protein [Hungatella]|uniref:Extracellular solute-binding protein n=1 Tax=Hungatella hathewayi TaxID=154046 RepID=A0AAW9WIB2_9FIRM|nr:MULTISPECIES: extracellular solute-binding protein [Hungatella]MCQ4832001.1 extracellular solute-binding protein [Hungatella sp. SL.1.14]MUB64939.1 extracellular solute-binding protein [Hungatella hathewayi]CUQ55147.1 extracellular solute-binding protein [Hungatella hathewayi]